MVWVSLVESNRKRKSRPSVLLGRVGRKGSASFPFVRFRSRLPPQERRRLSTLPRTPLPPA